LSRLEPIRSTVLALLALFGLAGCFAGHRRERPPDWPPSAEASTDGCPDLTGRFRGEAALDPFVPSRTYLPRLLLEHGQNAPLSPSRAPWLRAEAVEILVDGRTGDLAFTAQPAGSGSPKTLTFRRGEQYECRDGAVLFDPPAHWGNANVCAARTATQLQLWRAVDGSLVARSSSQEDCLGLAIFFGWKAEWYRFRPVTSAASAP
jgi:hypothetical protein